MSEHLTNVQIENFIAHRLPSGELVTATRHLAVCSECRQRVNAQTGAWERVAALQTSLRPEAQAVHLSYEDLAAYVDNVGDAIAHEISANHLGVCSQCTAIAQELQALRESLQPPISPARKTWLEWLRTAWPAPALLRPVFLTTAVAVVVLITFVWWRRPVSVSEPMVVIVRSSPKPAPSVAASLAPTPISTETPVAIASVNDRGGQITLDQAGNVIGVTALSKEAEHALKQALATQKLETPTALKSLARRPATLMGDAADAPAIKLRSPIGAFVKDAQPLFRWQAVPGAQHYTITVLDENFTAVATSPSLTQSSWRVTTPLQRGQTYLWQVTAEVDGKRLTSTSANTPEAHFRLLSGEKTRELQTLVQSNDSHLLRGVMYAKAGLLDEAERELQALLKMNPRSSIARRLLQNVRALR